jgi:uncharacterized protein
LHRTRLDPLNLDEALALLGTVPVGRIAITDEALPVILPVTFVMDGPDVIIRSVAGSKLAAATHGAVVAFEADDVDRTAKTGWSVMIVGIAQHVTDTADIAQLARLGLEPYVDRAPHYIRIRATRITGRRLTGRRAGARTD